MPDLEHVLASQDMVGECPYWNSNEQALYWVDILGNRFHRYHPTTGTWDTYTVDKTISIGAIAPCTSGAIVMATGNGFARYDLTTQESFFILHPEAHLRYMRFNDGSVDIQGRFWDGWNITCYDREGTKLSRINLPVQCPTSCAFGGEALDELYITSAREELNEEQRANQPLAGAIFRMKMGVTGLAQHLFLG
jgi:sugar lactone lactonase YvrE